MEQVCLVLPIQEGHADDARDFMRELEASRKPDYARSEERIGITKEAWFLAGVPTGEVLVGYMETGDFANALGLFSSSRDGFDLWFKQRMADCTGIDLNNPPAMTLPELLSHYSAQEAYA
jgi:hypothetical protein